MGPLDVEILFQEWMAGKPELEPTSGLLVIRE